MLMFMSCFAFGQTTNFFENTGSPWIQRIDPPNWFSGMNNREVELLFYSNDKEELTISLHPESEKYASLLNVEKSKLNNYYFVYLSVKSQPEDNCVFFIVNKAGSSASAMVPYSITPRSAQPLGLSQADAIYMIFPDRFANGNLKNDSIPNYFQGTHRDELKGRRGGDIQGICDHLDYISDLGFNALWINPMVENNEKRDSYHGYATTDSYLIDPRIGTLDELNKLTTSMKKKEMKHVWDVVYNHWGDQHKLFREMPDSNWFHWFPTYTKTNYRAETMLDPYASEYDKSLMANGWFDTHMPDLNQQDEHLSKYLIQNSLWWIEMGKIDAFRIDTYSYPDQLFMSKLNAAVKKEYPNFFLFGETWVQGSAVQAWFTEGQKIHQNFDSQLDGVTDFQLFYAMTKGLTEPFGWEEGLRRIELDLAHDHLYAHPENLVTFLDNHDLARIYSVYNKDFEKWKMAHAMLLTLRGIPCIYYGTEILMTGFCDPDAHVREEFPGGWPDHKANAFEKKGRTEIQNEAFDFLQTLLTYRKNNEWLATSKLTQFVPNDNTYAYARKSADGKKTLLCIYNLNEKPFDFTMESLKEITQGLLKGKNILDGSTISWKKSLSIPNKGFYIIEISR
jgi:glycosidase